MTPAQEWGARLRRVMSERGYTIRRLSEESGVYPERIVEWRAGRHLPLLRAGQMVSEALMSPRLMDKLVELRSRACGYCGRPFVDDTRGGRGKLTCSKECGTALAARKWRGARKREWGTTHLHLRNRLETHQAAVDAFCRSCEPEGRCRTADCPLRAVSPLPLAREAAA